MRLASAAPRSLNGENKVEGMVLIVRKMPKPKGCLDSGIATRSAVEICLQLVEKPALSRQYL